jgi:hypothetical protein
MEYYQFVKLEGYIFVILEILSNISGFSETISIMFCVAAIGQFVRSYSIIYKNNRK